MFSIQTVVGFLVFVAGILFAVLKLRRWVRILGKLIFVRISINMVAVCKDLFRPRKESLFRCLQDMPHRPLKVVEIGAGVGSNFEFFPKNTEVVCIEPNEFSKKELMSKASEYPDIKVTFEVGVAESLSSVATESVDAVISTHVLCSVSDVNQSLREALRVLNKGGKFIFMEHIEAVKGSRIQFWQSILNVIWPTLCQGCHLTRLINIDIQNAGFRNTELDIFEVDFKKFKLIASLSRRHCAGIATK